MIKLINAVLPEEYQNINKEERGEFHTEYIDDRQLLCMLDDKEIQVRDKDEECDLISQDENFDKLYVRSVQWEDERRRIKGASRLLWKLRNREIHAVDINQSPALLKLKELIDSLMNDLRSKSRTAKLWLAHIDCINTLKLFIFAERTGDWNTHLVAVGRMLNKFCSISNTRDVKSKYGICYIIFDGYSAGPSIKDHEHERRKTGNSSADIKIEEKLFLCKPVSV